MARNKRTSKYGKIELKEDCIFFNKKTRRCTALKTEYCKKEKCKFYKTACEKESTV